MQSQLAHLLALVMSKVAPVKTASAKQPSFFSLVTLQRSPLRVLMMSERAAAAAKIVVAKETGAEHPNRPAHPYHSHRPAHADSLAELIAIVTISQMKPHSPAEFPMAATSTVLMRAGYESQPKKQNND